MASDDAVNAAVRFIDSHLDEGRGAAIAIECQDRQISYASLHEQVNRAGSALRAELAVRPEERVLLLMLDGPEMVFAFFGAIKIGAVPIPTNTMWTETDYEFLLQDSRAAVVIVSAALYPRIEGVLPKCRWVRHVVVVGDVSDMHSIRFEALTSAGSPVLEASRQVRMHRRSGCTRLAVRGAPRHACTCSTTCRCVRRPTPATCWVSTPRIDAIASRSFSSRTVSATRCTFRLPSEQPASSGRGLSRRRSSTT